MEEIVKNEFLFYSKLAKPLVLNLPKSKDRILSAAWIKKFKNEQMGDEQLRTTYLKLLLFCLQRRKLTGIFADDPSNYEILEELPPDIDLNDFARNLMDAEKAERREAIRLEMMGDMDTFPAFTTDCSSDLTEYVAAQDIPNFGVHAFYAISRQPVNKWQRSELAIFPKGIKSAIDTTVTSDVVVPTCVCAPKGSSSAPEVDESGAESKEPDCRKKKEEKSPERKKRRPKKLGASPPTHPIGEVQLTTDERITPTWGTNLVEVRERTDIGHIEEPSEANKALDQEVAKMLEEAEEDEEEQQGPMETTASKAKAMVQVIEEFKRGSMDKSKKPPSRLAKLGDRSRAKAPKSLKAPKIAVKGMKKGKGKGGVGPKPANLPEEFADWTEKDLEEAGLTWADLMPIEENVDEELEQVGEDAMGHLEDGGPEAAQFDLQGYQEIDYDALILEAEAELAGEKTVYDQGLEEDEVIVEQFDDEIENLEDELNVSREAEELRTSSPALSRGIPVTTPHRSPSPRRVKSPEKVFAEEHDDLLAHRQSPLRPPRIPRLEPRRKRKHVKTTAQTDKDPHIAKVFKKAKKLVHEDEAGDELDEFERLERQFAEEAGEGARRRHPGAAEGHAGFADEDEFEMLERQFEREAGECPARSRGPTFSPGPADMVRQRARDQEQMLRSPEDRELEEFEALERGFRDEGGSPRVCPAGARSQAFSPGAAERVRMMARQQEDDLRRTPDSSYEQFSQQFAGESAGLDAVSPCFLSGSPPPLSEQEEYEIMLRRMSPETRDKELFSQQFADVNVDLDAIAPPEFFQSPRLTEDEEFEIYEKMMQSASPERLEPFNEDFDIGYATSDEEGSLGLLPRELIQQQPHDWIEEPRVRQKTPPFLRYEDEHFHRSKMIRQAAEQQEQLLRQGSPQAQEIIEEAERSFEDDIFKRVETQNDQIEGSPPPGIRTPLSAFASPISDKVPTPKRTSRPLRQASPPQRQPSPRQQSPPRPLTDTVAGPCPATRRSPSPRATPPSSFIPGVSSPLTPKLQRPLNRSIWYSTPPPPPVFGPEERPRGYKTPIPVTYGPSERPPYYRTPRDIFTCSPQGSPLDEVEMPDFDVLPPDTPFEALEDIEPPDFDMLPPSPEDPRRSPARRRPPAAPLDSTPAAGARKREMRPRRLFEDEEGPCEPCGPLITPPEPCEVCDAEEPGSPRRKRSRSKRRHHKHRKSSPDDLAEFEALEKEAQMEDGEAPCAGPPRPEFPSSPGEAQRVRDRAQRQYDRLMQDSPTLPPSQATGVPCASGMPTGLSPPPERIKRNKLKGKYPATPPPPAPQRPPSPIWSTPEGMSGPSRRPTGLSPEGYNSDFESTPPPGPPQPQRFPAPKLLIKRGKAPPSPRTPRDARMPPSPCSVGPGQRAPCGGGMGTPMRGDRQIRRTRLFDERGRTPRLPSALESPIVQSPWVTPHARLEDFANALPPLIEDEPPPEDMSPDTRPPILQQGQLYFPREQIGARTPEGLPTRAQLRRHRFTPDREHVGISSRTPFGRGPGPTPIRESCRAAGKMPQISEFESDDAYRMHLLFDQDLDTYDKYYHKPPSAYPPSQKPKHGHVPSKSWKSPRPKRPVQQLATYAEEFETHLRANVEVPVEEFPPSCHSTCPRKEIVRPGFEPQYDTARDQQLIRAAEEGNIQEHLADKAFEDIAWQFDTEFDYEGGLMDLSPPPEMGEQQNYYPDIVTGTESLLKSMQAFDFPSSAEYPPCASTDAGRRTIPRAPTGRSIPVPSGRSIPIPSGRSIPVPSGRSIPVPSGRSIPVPSGRSIPVPSGRRPGGRSIPTPAGRSIPVAPGSSIPRPPGVGRSIPSAPCGAGGAAPCGAAAAAGPRQIPQRRPAPPKPLRETKSSQLRKEKFARDQAAKEAQLKKEKMKKDKADARKRAAIQAKKAAARQETIISPGIVALTEELRRHEIHFPRYRGTKEGRKRVSRSQFAGFRDHPLEEDEMQDLRYPEIDEFGREEDEDIRYPSCQGSSSRRRRAADDRDIRYPDIGEMEGHHIEGNINYPAVGLLEEDNERGPVDHYHDDYDHEGTFQGSDEDIYDPSEHAHILPSLPPFHDVHDAVGRSRRQPTEEEDLREFEELERLLAEDNVCPGAAAPRQIPQRRPAPLRETKSPQLRKGKFARAKEDIRYPTCQGSSSRRKRAADDRDIRYPDIGEMEGHHIEGNINYPAVGLLEEDNERGPVDHYHDDYDHEGTFQGSDEDIYDPSEHAHILPSLPPFHDVHEAVGRSRRLDRRQPTEEEELNEFEELERLLGEEKVCPGGAAPRYPVAGVTYSPPRPQSRFGPGLQKQPAQHLPLDTIPQVSSCPWNRQVEQDPNDAFLLDDVLPPIFDEMEEEDRLPSPGLQPRMVRQEVESRARTEYDPAFRGDVLPKARRRVARSPCAAVGEIQEEAPLIPCFAEVGSFREGRDERKRRRRHPEERRTKRKKHRRVTSEDEEAYGVMDDPLPRDLPSPRMRPQRPCPRATPGRQAYQTSGKPLTAPIYTEFYKPPADLPIHPDLVDLAGYDFGSPFQAPEGVGLEDEQEPEDLFFSPPRYPELEEEVLDRRAVQSWQPPEEVTRSRLTSPVAQCPAFSPEGSPLGLLDEGFLEQAGSAYLMTPPGEGLDQRTVEEFFAGSPIAPDRDVQFRRYLPTVQDPPGAKPSTPTSPSPRSRSRRSPDREAFDAAGSPREPDRDVQFRRYLPTVQDPAGAKPPTPTSPSPRSRSRRSPDREAFDAAGPCGVCGSPSSGPAEILGPDQRTVDEFLRHASNGEGRDIAEFRRHLKTVGAPPRRRGPIAAGVISPSYVFKSFRNRIDELSEPSSPATPSPRAARGYQRTPSPAQQAFQPPGSCEPCETPSFERFQRLAQSGEFLDDYGMIEDYQSPEGFSPGEGARGAYETPSPQRFAGIAEEADLLDYETLDEYQTPEQISPGEYYPYMPQLDRNQQAIEDMLPAETDFDPHDYGINVSQTSDLFDEAMPDEIANYLSPSPFSPRPCPALSASPQTPKRPRAAPAAEQPRPEAPEPSPPRGCRGRQQVRPLEEFIRGPLPGPEPGPIPQQYSVEEAQKRAAKRLRKGKGGMRQPTDREFAPDRAEEAQLGEHQCAANRRWEAPDSDRGGAQSAEVVTLEDYLRAGPVPGAGPERSQEPQKPARKQVRKTTSVTKIVTRRNR